MYNQSCFPHASACCPHCGSSYPPPYYGVCHEPPVEYCQACCRPVHECCCNVCTVIKYPQELFADGSASLASVETFIGGVADVHITLDYISSGSATSNIEIKIDSVSVLNISPALTGYNVKKLPIPVSPGAVVQLNVTDAKARLRWCEDLVC